jgi:hypothetical protein
MDNLLDWLQNVYADDFCNGSWEHEYGFFISNIDNPGWDFKFELIDSDIEDIPLDEVIVNRSKYDWYHCKINDGVFHGWGGAKNLIDIISVFKEWYTYASSIADERNKENGKT